MNLVKTPGGNYLCPDDPGEKGPGTAQRLSITDAQVEILSAAAIGRAVLEIGTGLGVSTRGLLKTARAVYTIDPDLWVHRHIWPDLRAQGAITAPSLNELPLDFSFDLAFVDGDHSTASALADLRFCAGKPVFLHDWDQESVRDAAAQTDYRVLELWGHVPPKLVLLV